MFFTARKKISKISDGLEKAIGEKSGEKIKVYSRDEITRLEAVFKKVKDKIDQLEREKSQAQAILNSMIEGVIALDKDCRIVSLNPTVEKMFRVVKDQTKGKFFLEAIPNNDLYEIISIVFKKREVVFQELTLVWPVQRIFQVNASPIFDADAVSGCLLVIHDITEMRKLETIRSDFVANVSHELKTPLTSIKGFVETLLEGALEDKDNGRHFLEIIQEHTDRLNNLINDLLELSFLESREIKLDIVKVNLKDLIEKVISGFKSKLSKRDIGFDNRIAPEMKVSGDSDKLEQVLTNLIDNAIKFSPDRSKIKIYSENLEDKVRIIIEDSGPGISAKHIPRLFERFYRVDKARSRELGGTGLGLSIVKHIIELHKGTVGVESTEGLGSKFWFILSK